MEEEHKLIEADVGYLKGFLSNICPPLLFSDSDLSHGKDRLTESFADITFQAAIEKFTKNGDFPLLLVELSSEGVTISLEVEMRPKVLSRIAIIKYKNEPLVESKPCASQVQIMTMAMDPDATLDEMNTNFYNQLLSLNRCLFSPLIRVTKSAQESDCEKPTVSTDEDPLTLVQRRIRDLDLALEQCQKGTLIPTINFEIVPSIKEFAKRTDVKTLSGHLEKFNVAQVDLYLAELKMTVLLAESDAKEELIAAVINSTKVWKSEITRQGRPLEFPFPGSVEKEMHFWTEMNSKLEDSKSKINSAPSLLTKLVLKRFNKIAEQRIQEAEMDLDEYLKLVASSLSFLRDFPIHELLNANSLFPKLSKGVNGCLNHFSKLKSANATYNFTRALRLLEVLGQVVFDKIIQILKEKGIMTCSVTELRQLKTHLEDVFLTWKTNLTAQRGVLKDVAKRRNEKSFALNFNLEHLQKRLVEICEFREQHEKLVTVLHTVLATTNSSESEHIEEVNFAYKIVTKSGSDIFDITPRGVTAWGHATNGYERELEKIDEHICSNLTNQLNATTDADEMFQIFSRYNALFFRPAIKNAVHSFRSTLVTNVRDDVRRLQEKFKQRYDNSSERVTADLRDIPPLSGRILWARQIETQLHQLMQRMQDVLGEGWEDQLEGKQLKGVCSELLNYLDIRGLYEEWLTNQLKEDGSKHSKVKDFLLLVEEDPRDGHKYLKVNFDNQQVVVFKEVKYLDWLLPNLSLTHKTIPGTIKSRSDEAYMRYPIALALNSALSSFTATKMRINVSNDLLLVSHQNAVREVIKEAIGGSKRNKWVKWDTNDLNNWIQNLTSQINLLQETVDVVTTTMSEMEELLTQLTTCPYEQEVFTHIMSVIQDIIDDLPSKGLTNIQKYVHQLDKRIEFILTDRLINTINIWVDTFKYANMDENQVKKMKRKAGLFPDPKASTKDEKEQSKAEDFIEMEVSTYEVVLAKQVLFITPPLEDAKVYWVNAFHSHLSMVASLKRVSMPNTPTSDYGNLLKQLPHEVLETPYITIDEKLSQAQKYVEMWLQYQPLWDAAVAALAESIGRDNVQWQEMLKEIANARITVEEAKEFKPFGPIIISNRQAQNKILIKYDQWQKDSQVSFGRILLEDIRTENKELVRCKDKLEICNLNDSNPDIIANVQFILECKQALPYHEKTCKDLKNAEKLLQIQRFAFPNEWMPTSNVTGPLEDMKTILAVRITAMEAALPSLKEKLTEENESNLDKSKKFVVRWNKDKPISGELQANDVLQSLADFAEELTQLRDNMDRVQNAMRALDMVVEKDESLELVDNEMFGIKEAWEAVQPITNKLAAAGQEKIKDVVINKLRKKLDALTEECENLPAKIRSYPIVETVMERIKLYIQHQPLVRDMATEALKDRHWKELHDLLPFNMPTPAITAGDIWRVKALDQKKAIMEILAKAQGELALEEFLKSLREVWTTAEIELVPRDGIKILVIEEEVFGNMEDHLTSLTALKQSPYFKNVPEFQEETIRWESNLTTLRQVTDALLEVQRKWLYLRGIFKSKDIQQQLPQQYNKFKAVDQEITILIKRIATKPLLLELLQVDNLSKNLERQDSTMALIQKSLNEYLERQRVIFPRFYFVNNDDLVEIIGNSNEPEKIVTHFVKMFSAMTAIKMVNQSGKEPFKGSDPPIYPQHGMAMGSKEGEFVPFDTIIDLAEGVKDWLATVESQMTVSLATLLQSALAVIPSEISEMLDWINKFPAQAIMLASQVSWCAAIENGLDSQTLVELQVTTETQLRSLSESVLQDMDPPLRKKCEQLLTEMVHQRDTGRLLLKQNVPGKSDFGWVYHLRFYWDPNGADILQKASVKMANASFFYGFEYLGIAERLVHTGLTDRCYLTLTQALHFGLGGNPFGPAGTGKTESVKMLGAQMGRFCLVFNCDKSFDYAAMGRIFAGLAQVGAWGCFDEFNRLEERILSAVSQQILGIQKALMYHEPTFELMGNPCKLSRNIGIFVTMNPGYAGRSNLPDNLKQMFRAVAMAVPDRKLIAQVMLYSQGIVTAESLAGNIVLLFTLCEEQLSQQSHYDFGLRALKSVLVSAGELKRNAVKKAAAAKCPAKSVEEKKYINEEAEEGETEDNEEAEAVDKAPESEPEAPVEIEKPSEEETAATEKSVLIEATCGSIVPKLVAEDIPLFTSLLAAVFPGCPIPQMDDDVLISALKTVCAKRNLDFSGEWAEKLLQLKALLDVRHGVMLVGPSGTGKTSAWSVLLEAIGIVDGQKSDYYIIDPKAIPLTQLYGNLDPNSLEWTDGVFTKLLRKVADTSNGKQLKRSWIILDGDVDPDWAENLNSVLDDNKLLTLPSGDRLKVPPNVRIIIEVDTLRHATLATVSRAGMVWYADETLTLEQILRMKMQILRTCDIASMAASYGDGKSPMAMDVQKRFCDAVEEHFKPEPALIGKALSYALGASHIMEITTLGVLSTLMKMLKRGIALAINYNDAHEDDQMTDEHLNKFATKWLFFCTVWSFGGSMNVKNRYILSDMIEDSVDTQAPNGVKLLDLSADVESGEWHEWSSMVPTIEIESSQVTATNIIVATTDTVRNYVVIESWLESHKPLILCGPPGSGKSMTLTNVLDNSPQYILAALNFSAGSQPDLIHKTFDQYCEVVDSQNGLTMMPSRANYREDQWLVLFLDECNLPAEDDYGTQAVIMFVRQCVEQNGFWNDECKWVNLKRIQFVGACNPPTDAGRVLMSNRFLRHAPLMLVDYPVEESFKQIYGTFVNGLLKLHSNLRPLTEPLTAAMVRCFLKNQIRFTPDVAPQYIYSPRELSRWMRALYGPLSQMPACTNEELVRLWCNEGLRLFHDRCMTDEERKWVDDLLIGLAEEFFAPVGVDVQKALIKPMLFSHQVTKLYESLDIEVLRKFLEQRLKVFCEEELDVPLVLFDDVLDHILRIDNVLKNPMGHLLLVGESGVGKTVLTKFVSWMNGLSIFTIKANSRYTILDFENDLRIVMRRGGVDFEKISFIFDESNALDSSFLELMNALLASGEVPGLFEGDERTQLLNAAKEAFGNKGIDLTTESEIERAFTKAVQQNVHVIFTMNPAGGDFAGRCTTSPALFNRCVVDWFGTWPFDGLTQVGYEFTHKVDGSFNTYEGAIEGSKPAEVLEQVMAVLKREEGYEPALVDAVTAALICIHESSIQMTVRVGKLSGRYHFFSPRDYLDFIRKFLSIEEEKRGKLQMLANNIRTGLNKLMETQVTVDKMQKEMVIKAETLKQKEIDANLKLQQMMESQNEAVKQKGNAEALTVELEKENAAIAIRKKAVEQELSEAEPMLQAAKQAVDGVKKSDLDEVRALGKPPVPVRATMECVVIMLGESPKKVTDWAEVKKFMKNPDFLKLVLEFDPYKITPEIKKVCLQRYLDTPDLNQEMVDKASKACGPLFLWAGSVIKYSTLLNNIKPMTDEVAMLEKLSEEKDKGRLAAIKLVEDLENEILQYKADYAVSVRDTEAIKADMEITAIKGKRATDLLASLEGEKQSWSAISESFDKQMQSLIGDNLVTAAFLTYSGVFDHKVRKRLIVDYQDKLENLGIVYRSDLDVIEYLSNASDHLQWRDWGLPFDDLALQNAILLERFNRFPMIIDPSGQATNFICQKYSHTGKMVKTSFLDPNFTKILATAIRFGNPIIVQDVETLDPVLNPILNKEFQKQGGRTLIRVGTEEIDFSPSFVIFLTTRNPLAQFSPDLCSRTTVVNFSVTPASLETQALTTVLKSERPDVDRRRTEVLKLQGAQNAKSQELQDEVLAKISAVEGNILDDNSVIETLERIKKETAELNESIRETLETLEDLKKVSNLYQPIAVTLAAAYFSLDTLPDVLFLYQYSLNFFFDVLDKVLVIVPPPPTEFHGNDEAIAADRLTILKAAFFRELSRRTLRGLMYADQVMFIVRLAQVYDLGDPSKELSEDELDLLLKGGSAVMLDSSTSMLNKFKDALPDNRVNDNIAKACMSLGLLPSFTGLHASLTEDTTAWTDFMDDAEPEKMVPIKWIKPLGDEPDSAQRVALLQLLIIKCFRPERVLFAMDNFVTSVFGKDFDWRELARADLKVIVTEDSKASSPIMLCSGPGQDASGKVDLLATELSHKLLSVSMGAGESFIEAEKNLALACKSGAWLMLKNVHLCADWLALLEKRLNGMEMAEDFRLFLTSEIHPKLPPALLRGSEVVVYEASTGVKANILRFYQTIPVERIEKKPVERVRMYGLLCWFNAVVQERLRYTPMGWTKKHEFTEADTNVSLNTMDQWIDNMAGDRSSVDPSELPWDALRKLISETLFGGRIDHPFDQDGLDSFITSVFTPKNYGSNADLAFEYDGTPLVTLPKDQSREALEDWMKALPDTNSPAWIGLPVTAESQLKIYMAQKILGNLLQFQMSIDASDMGDDDESGGNKALQEMLERWIAVIPMENALPDCDPSMTTDATSMPLERYFAREVTKGRAISKLVHKDISLVKRFCTGEEKTSVQLRALMECFQKGMIPPRWIKSFTISERMKLPEWIADCAARLKCLDSYRPVLVKGAKQAAVLLKMQSIQYWMGGLLLPEAMVTATRQQAAQVNKWALDQIELYLDIGGDIAENVTESVVTGLILEGAKFQDGVLKLSEELRCNLPTSKLIWREKSARVEGMEPLKFPFYLNDNRNDKMVIVVLIDKSKCDPEVEPHVWVQRSVGFIMQTPV